MPREDIPEELPHRMVSRAELEGALDAFVRASRAMADVQAERDEARAQAEALAEALETAKVGHHWCHPSSQRDGRCGCGAAEQNAKIEAALRAFRSSQESSDATSDLRDEIAHQLYAGGPYGEFICFLDDGARAITDAHSMKVYGRIVDDVLAAFKHAGVGILPPEPRESSDAS